MLFVTAQTGGFFYYMAEREWTKVTKHEFNSGGVPLDASTLLSNLYGRRAKFPHIGSQAELNILGQLGKSGVIVTNGQGEIVGSVRAPNIIPTQIDGPVVLFGGVQADNHIETSIERPAPVQETVVFAKALIQTLKEADNFDTVSQIFSRFGGVGSEPERWILTPDGAPAPFHMGELQKGLSENSLNPYAPPEDFLYARSADILRLKQELGDGFILADMSTIPTGRPDQMQVADSGDLGPYVRAIQHFLYTNYLNASDPLARQLMDTIGSHFGYGDFQGMKSELGDMAFWSVAASHASVGMHHRRAAKEAMWIPEMEAIAVGDIFNSNLATLAEFLMMSSPVVYGMVPTVTIDGQDYPMRDVRSIMRYALDTTHPSDFIRSPEVMRARIIDMIVSGKSHTIDRSSYVADVNGNKVPCMHGRVRNRMFTHEPMNQTGRIEFTGCSSSPSLHDEAARNSLLQIMAVGAFEALANGMHPVEYFGTKFPNLAEWEGQKRLSIEANLFGFNHPEVGSLIDEGIRFIQYMEEQYPALKEQCRLAANRLANLRAPAANSLEEYRQTSQGPISEVLMKELASGTDPLTLAARVDDYQTAIARDIVNMH